MLNFSRKNGITVLYTAKVHRDDFFDVGFFGYISTDYESSVFNRRIVGAEIYPEVAPQEVEHIIKKHRYSAFYGTDLDIILRTKEPENLAIAGLMTEDCCFATAYDAMYRGYKVSFLSDVTSTYDY